MEIYYVYLDEENFRFWFSIEKPKSKILITLLDEEDSVVNFCGELDNLISILVKDNFLIKNKRINREIEYMLSKYFGVVDNLKRSRLFFYLKNKNYICKLHTIKKILK